MGIVRSVAALEGIALGALLQVVNTAASRLPLPIGPLAGAPIGDLFEPRGTDAKLGASLVERALGGGPSGPDQNARRTQRRLLASTTVDVAANRTTTGWRLSFEATAPGNDWATPGRESALVAVYVDGRYHSTTIVMQERGGGYHVALGTLPAGRHTIELRSAADESGRSATVPTIARLRAAAVDARQAQIDLHAPILELRDTDADPAIHSASHSDAPLQLVPSVRDNEDGTRTIDYNVLFSNEDGGTATPRLLTRYGRSTDYELVYSVTLDRAGRIVREHYQGALHRVLDFTGTKQGRRPVLRIATSNNMVSERTGPDGATMRWSPAPTAPVAAGTPDTLVLRATPWAWAVMGKELLREGKALDADSTKPLSKKQVADPRLHVYLGPLDQAARSALLAQGKIELVLTNGLRIAIAIAPDAAGGSSLSTKVLATAVALPVGAYADAIAGVSALRTADGRVFRISATVLDDRFVPRELAHV